MSTESFLDPDSAWAAFLRRDRNLDGQFVGAVKSTGIYCKPSCPARHPKRENMVFYPDGAAAREAGYRACLRCKPDDLGRDRIAVARAITLIEGAEDAISLEELAAWVGYAPHHFHRLFKRATGITPAAYARGLRAERATKMLLSEPRITDVVYEAGYTTPSRFYADADKRLGMTPSAWKRGGAGVTVRWTVAQTSLGPLLIAATDRGLCRVSFDENETALRARFPNADIQPGGQALAALARKVVEDVEHPDRHHDLPIDVQGTAFQEAVWQALCKIPVGETRSYAEIAALAGKPRAVRAVGTACGANNLAVIIPCHRVQRSDGSIGGYAYGTERKIALLKREGNVEI